MYRFISSVLLLQTLIMPVTFAGQDGNLETIIVSATRSNTSDVAFPGAITVITSEDIRQSGAEQLVDALRNAGGLNISDLYGDGTDASVGIRGFSETAQQNTLIMIDGRRLNNADNGLPDLNSIALSNVDRIEIINGSAGTLFGDKAVGGVINIITRSPDSLHVEAKVDYGSYNNRSAFAAVENTHDNGIYYRFSAKRRLNDNYRDHNRLQLTDVAANAGYRYSSGEVFLEYQNLNEDIQLPGSLFRDLLAKDRKQTLNPADFTSTDSWIARAGIRQDIIEGIQFQGEFTNRMSDTSGQLSSGGFPTAFTQKRKHTEFTPRFIGTFQLPAGQALVTLGSDIFITDYLIKSPFGMTDDTQTQYGIYVQGILPLTERIDLTVGARRGRVENDILVETGALGRSLPAGTGINDNANAWEAGLSYVLNDNWRLYARAERNFRFVTADEYSAVADNNFFTKLYSFGTIVPLPKTQTGQSYETGVEWNGDNTFARGQFYQLDLNDEIVFNPALFLNTNIGDTRRRGVILEGRYSPADNWTLFANYSFIDAEVTSGTYDGSELTFISNHTAKIAARYRYNDQLSAYLEFLGVSDRVFGGDFANTFVKLPGYAIANMNLAYRYKSFTASLRVNNLLDRHYSDSGNIGYDFRDPFFPQVTTYFPAPERNFLFSLSYAYDR